MTVSDGTISTDAMKPFIVFCTLSFLFCRNVATSAAFGFWLFTA